MVISLAVACLVVLALLGLIPAPASRAASQPAALDLAAMALQPQDLPAGFGFLSSQIITADTQAQAINEARGGKAAGAARLVYQLTSDGWQRGQQIFFGMPRQGDPTQAATAIGTVLVEYADAGGASAGFALTENATGVKNVATMPASHTVGDESLITVDRRLANDPKQPQVWIDLTFRVDNLVATVAIINYSKTSPRVAALEPLATKLQQRIAAVRAGKGAPGLSTRAVRLAGADVVSFYDHYERLDNKTFPYLGEAASALAAQDKAFASAGMSDVYYVYQAVGQTDRPDYVLYQLYIEHFAQEQDAEVWLRDTPGEYVANPTQGGTAALVPGAPTVGDGSAMASYRYPRQDKTTATGYVVFLRVGQIGATVQLDGVPNVPRAAVEQLAADEAVCLAKGGCLKPVAPPPGLHVQQPAGTPAATAVAAPAQATPTATATIPPLVLPGATATARPGASEPAAEAIYRGNAAHTGTQPGPGPTGQLAVRWQWKAVPGTNPLDGQMTSPTLANGVVYVGTGVAGGEQRGIHAVDAATGKVRWSYHTESPVTAAPTVAGGIVYAVDYDFNLYAVDAKSGKLVWKGPGSRYSAPTVVDGVVYVSGMEDTTGAYVVRALDAKTGKQIWRFQAAGLIETGATVVDGVVYIGGSFGQEGSTYPGALYALDAKTGRQLWRLKTPSAGADSVGDVDSTIAVYGGTVYAVTHNGTLYAVDAATGKVRWQFQGCSDAPAVTGGVVYCGGVSLSALDSQTGTKRWKVDLGVRLGEPVVAGGAIYVAGNGTLYVLDAATGNVRSRVAAPIELNQEVSPLVVAGTIYVNGRDDTGRGTLLAIGGTSSPAMPGTGG